MKRLLFIFGVIFSCKLSAQSFSVKNANDEYVVTSMRPEQHILRNLQRINRDFNGLYWFLNSTELNSFDGVNWKSHKIKSAKSKNVIIRMNDLEISDDGKIWLATEGGMYVYDEASGIFIPMKQMFPGKYESPYSAVRIYAGIHNFAYVSLLKEGFYLFDIKSKTSRHIMLDSLSRTEIPTRASSAVTEDRKGGYWGITSDNKGIWYYNSITNKLSCSWKGELPKLKAKRLTAGLTDITYCQKEDVLWLCYGTKGILEKFYLPTGISKFYSFTGELRVYADSTAPNPHKLYAVRIDKEGNGWINIDNKYLVRLDNDIQKMQYLTRDPNLLPFAEMFRIHPERSPGRNDVKQNNNNLLWIAGRNELSILKKRNNVVRQVRFDIIPGTGIRPADFENVAGRRNVFFEKGRNNNYFLLQQDTGRPKLIYLDENLRIKKALLGNTWKQYPAYFNTVFHPDTIYIALMRPGIEPLDFRKTVIKDFRIDLQTLKEEEVDLNFRQRVWRYGAADAKNNYWLFSAGYLFSYDPKSDILDSIFICEPAAKGAYPLEFVKGFDYPTILHRNSSTFWITFPAARQLYKINMLTKRIEKIFNCCIDKTDCNIPGGVYDMYSFDSSRIYLQLPFSSVLMNVFNDSIVEYADLFKNKLPPDQQNGSGLYKEWIYQITPAEINILNTVTGAQKKLSLNNDFKWILSQFNSRPLVNDKGEMILMSSAQNGFVVFNIDSVAPVKPGNVRISALKVNGRNLLPDSVIKLGSLSLDYRSYNSIYLRFSEYSIEDQKQIAYQSALYSSGDTVWSQMEGEPEITFSGLSSGDYRLLLRATNGQGDYSERITELPIVIIPPFWQTAWFKILILAALGMVVYGIYRYRMGQLIRLQTIRNNIASDLHDDIGSTLNSISIYSEVAKQQAGKEIPALDLIGLNSRKIIESMSDIVWTINPENDSFEKIIIRMRSFAYQLLRPKNIEFSFESDEKLKEISVPMQVRKNFYLIFKEAITNVVKYSGATFVSILINERNKIIILEIRDNGIGMEQNIEVQGNGLINMKRRAREIHAELKIESKTGEGTAIALMLQKQDQSFGLSLKKIWK